MPTHLRPAKRLGLWAVLAATLTTLSPAPAAQGANVSEIQRELDDAAAEYSRLESELADTDERRRRLEEDLAEADRIIAEKEQQVQVRAGAIYKMGGIQSYLTDLFLAPSPNVFFRRLYFLEVLGRDDVQLVDSLQVMQGRADEMRAELSATRSAQARVVERQRDHKRLLEAKLRGARGGARVSRIRNFDSFTLPIAGPQAFANTWGARRSGGRRHKGTDVMAACGAPVVAVTSGVLHNLHSGGNGGTMAYLRAGNGDVFFYAHLRNYAPGIGNGSRVTTGQRIGTNGNTGNARGGPCHVHFEWHKGGGSAVNPYPLLNAAR